MPEPKPEYFREGDVVSAMVFAPIWHSFDYIAAQDLQIGDLVEVPFGAKTRKAVIWSGAHNRTNSDNLKSIQKRLNYPPMKENMRKFVEVMSNYTLTPIGQILPMLYRAKEPLPPKPNALRPVESFNGTLTPKRQKIYDALLENKIQPLEEIDASHALIQALIKDGAAQYAFLEAKTDPLTPSINPLSEEQGLALAQIRATKKPVLLKGITGSGKTEVYLEAISEHFKESGQALVLLPEIALTAAFLERFKRRFGFEAGHWHSDMSVQDRRKIWHGVASGEIRAVIGARSALFLPFQNLKIIVVDEEHDRGFKQEEGVIYSGRDMAVLRGHIEGAQLILASATPSVESVQNAASGRYTRVDLQERFGASSLPEMRPLDMREAGLDASHWLSPHLLEAMRVRIQRGEQSLLFLNRRGFAPLTLCRACGHQMACPHCDARLVEHRHWGGLHCHQCGFQMPIPKTCPHCEAEGKLVPIGPGVERLAEEVEATLSEARICILSSDLMGNEASLRRELRAIENGEYDVIIGTQMAAKGHNFPLLTLVGIVDADMGLEGADLRAAEQSFQILRQVSGRAGRFDLPGKALVQTYQPDHPILRAIMSQDDTRYYEEEIARRSAAFAPPFSRYIAIIIWANAFDEALNIGRALLQNSTALQNKNIQIWGPVAAPIARIRSRARVRMLLKMPKSLALHEDVRLWANSVKTSSKIKIQIDVDPVNFL